MKLRIAKKILKCQSEIPRNSQRKPVRFWGNYSGHQKLLASVRLFKYASRNKLGQLALEALFLRPIDAFQPDDQVDLKFERLIGQYGRKEPLTISKKHYTPPPQDQTKPVYTSNGQIANPNALPFPGKRDKVSYEHVKEIASVKDQYGNVYEYETLSIKTNVEYSKIKDRSRWTFLRYQARDNNTRKVPKYHV